MKFAFLKTIQKERENNSVVEHLPGMYNALTPFFLLHYMDICGVHVYAHGHACGG